MQRLPLYTLFVTTLISVTGDVMAAIAIPWFVLETTGSTVQMGIVAFFSVSPIIIGMFFGGALVDRLGYKRVSAVADLASGIMILLIPILHTTIGLAFWQLLLLVFLGNLMDSPGRSARRAMLPELAEAAHMALERATGINQSLQRATTMIGAPIAGLLIATVDATGILTIDAITFGLSALGVFLLIPSHLINENKATQDNTYWQDIKEGYRFVRQDRLLLSLIIVIMVTNMIDYSMSAVTYPVYMRTLFGEQEGATLFGLLVGFFGASALISGLLFSWLGHRVPSQRWLLAIVFVLLSIRFFVFATFPPIWGLVIIVIISGFLAGPINPIIDTITYRRVPDTMRGRVFGMLSAGVLIAMPLGGVIGGHLLEWFNLQTTLIVYGVFYVLATGSLALNRQMQAMDTPSPIIEASD